MRALWCVALLIPLGAQALGPVGPGLVVLPGAEVFGGATYTLRELNVGLTETSGCLLTNDSSACKRERHLQQGDNNPLGLLETNSAAWVDVGNSIVYAGSLVRVASPMFGRGVAASAQGGLIYQFQVSGPENTAVPITMHYQGAARLGAEWVGTLNPQAGFRPEWPGGFNGRYINTEWQVVPGASYVGSIQPVFSRFLSDSDFTPGTSRLGANAWIMNWGVNDAPASFTVMANSIYTVRLLAHVDLAESVFHGTGVELAAISLSAWADPYFEIAPTWQDASQYSLAFSPGILNTPPVPEASTVAMWTGGLLALSAVARRRRSARLQHPTRVQ